MTRIPFLFLVCVPFLIGSYFAREQRVDRDESAMLKTTPSIAGDTYQCSEMVQVANHLRKLGKDKSLAALRTYLTSGGDNDKVLVICRLLFVNPKGWGAPILGQPSPSINQDTAKKFPLFPVALSDGVPFLLVEGYQLEGLPESANDCLKLCEGFALVKEDYSTADYEKAARALTQTKEFRQLYQEADRQAMADMILRQAKTVKVPEKK